jgi:putative Holliday junction resolvase
MAELRRGLPQGLRLLGLDLGARQIGVALSDVGLMLASPYGAVKRGKLAANAAEIGGIARREGARDWARDLAGLCGLPTAMWDERLSSAAVNRFLIAEADMTRGRRSAVVDRMAAAYMLQGALDATRQS